MREMGDRHRQTDQQRTLKINSDAPNYLASAAGAFAILELIISITVLICVGSTMYSNGYTPSGFIWFTCISGITNAVILLGVFISKLPYYYDFVAWKGIVLLVNVVWMILYLVSGAIATVGSVYYKGWYNINETYPSAAFFCWFASVLYAVAAPLGFFIWPKHQPREHIVTVPIGPIREPEVLRAEN